MKFSRPHPHHCRQERPTTRPVIVSFARIKLRILVIPIYWTSALPICRVFVFEFRRRSIRQSRKSQDTAGPESITRECGEKQQSETSTFIAAMGKKSKRKAAKAAAAAAGGTSTGGSSSSNGQQLILGPRPDGITCTNEDPNVCAVCSSVLLSEASAYVFRVCCGTKICNHCRLEDGCGFCNHQKSTTHDFVSLTKKRAKEGFPWACYFFAELYRVKLPGLSQSSWESVRWHERAASKDHPVSCIYLARSYAEGIGCKKNLEKARIMFGKAIRLRADDLTFNECLIFKIGYNLALELLNSGNVDGGLSLLLALAERGNGDAQYFLFSLHGRVGDHEGARYWATTCSENPNSPAAAINASTWLRRHCLVRHWYSIELSKKWLNFDREYVATLRKDAHDMLRDLRQTCAWCQTNLDRSTRKMCKGCKSHCYCSEGCQRAHWNAEENDHRSECQKVMEVKKKVAAMKK